VLDDVRYLLPCAPKDRPDANAKSMKARHLTLIPLLTIIVLAVSVTSCTHKRKDFETAKSAVA
jgi:hypothetical protein